MTKEQLFQRKGELTFQVQVAQAELQQIDAALVKFANEAAQAQVTSNGAKPEEAKVS